MLAAVLFAVLAQATPEIPEGSFPLVDQGESRPQFAEFRRVLERALVLGNKEFVLSRIASDVRYGFGEDDTGKTRLLQLWNNGRGEQYHLNQLLETVRLGGGFQTVEGKERFWAPYTHPFWPDNLDPYVQAIAVGPNVNVYQEPDESSEVIQTLTYEAVNVLSNGDTSLSDRGWTHVSTAEGNEGYVREGQVRRGIDLRVSFEEINGSFFLTTYVIGD
ncbi:MAG: SH3 domain-containing protein [Fimbriimonadaceae bacterium]